MRITFMKRITHVVLMFALAAVASSSALGQKALAKGGKTMTSGPQATAVAEEILQLERMYDQAFIRPTAEEMERLHTDDFMMTARGKVTTRAELLARLNDPNHRRDVIESLTTDDVKVRGQRLNHVASMVGVIEPRQKLGPGCNLSARRHHEVVGVQALHLLCGGPDEGLIVHALQLQYFFRDRGGLRAARHSLPTF